jgi:hypothetical protein
VYLIIPVLGHQIPDEDLVRRFRIQDLEPELQGIADFGRVDVGAAALRDLHDDVGRVHAALFEQRWLDLAFNGLNEKSPQ